MKYNVTVYPYAVQYGDIDVPDDVDNIKEYILEHWGDITFGDVDLDYSGTDFDYETDPDEFSIEKQETFTIKCYGKIETFPEDERDEQIRFYQRAMLSSMGSEQERYVNIYSDLISGSKDCCDEH